MFLNVILVGLLVLALAIIIYALYAVREEFLQYRRIQNGAVFVEGAWTDASTKRVKRTRDEKRKLKAERKAAQPLVRELHKRTKANFGVELMPWDIEKLIVKGGAMRLDAYSGVRYDKQSQELVKVGLHS